MFHVPAIQVLPPVTVKMLLTVLRKSVLIPVKWMGMTISNGAVVGLRHLIVRIMMYLAIRIWIALKLAVLMVTLIGVLDYMIQLRINSPLIMLDMMNAMTATATQPAVSFVPRKSFVVLVVRMVGVRTPLVPMHLPANMTELGIGAVTIPFILQLMTVATVLCTLIKRILAGGILTPEIMDMCPAQDRLILPPAATKQNNLVTEVIFKHTTMMPVHIRPLIQETCVSA